MWGLTERALIFQMAQESLLAALMDVCDVLIKTQFIVQDEAEALHSSALHHHHRLAVDGSGVMRGCECIAGDKDELLQVSRFKTLLSTNASNEPLMVSRLAQNTNRHDTQTVLQQQSMCHLKFRCYN